MGVSITEEQEEQLDILEQRVWALSLSGVVVSEDRANNATVLQDVEGPQLSGVPDFWEKRRCRLPP